MNRYPENTRGIMLTNVNGTDDNVLVFTTLTKDELEAVYAKTKVTFDECYEIPEQDFGYYLYEPCILTLKEEARARELLAA
jgi:hypothetical protein